jgi:hypothetical protein
MTDFSGEFTGPQGRPAAQPDEGSEPKCFWCCNRFTPRRGGSPRRFCSPRHRKEFHSAARRFGERAVAAGILTIADLRSGAGAACTLLEAAAPTPTAPEKENGTRRTPSILGAVGGRAGTVEDQPPRAPSWVAPTRPFALDPVEVWDPRLRLFFQRRMWLPAWGPRPDQDGCAAPEQLLEDYAIRGLP